MIVEIAVEIAIVSGFLCIVVLVSVPIVCNRIIRKKVYQKITKLDTKVQEIERRLTYPVQAKRFDEVDQLRDSLQTLSQLVQGRTTQHRTDEPLLVRVERLEQSIRELWQRHQTLSQLVQGRTTQHRTDEPLKATKQVGASRYSVNPEEVAFILLDVIEPEGRRSQLARMAGLNDWLKQNYPRVVAEPLGTLNQDLWRLIVLTSDRKTGIVSPALDSPIGPQESLKWFEGGGYDGTQALVRANVSVLAQAVRDEETQTWQPQLKGKIDLT